MEKINQQLYTKHEAELPLDVHQYIMKRVTYLKFRPLFFMILIIFVINMYILSSNINSTLLSAEFMDMVTDFTTDSYAGLLVLTILLEKFFEIISIKLVISLLLNSVGAVYILNKLIAYRFTFKKAFH